MIENDFSIAEQIKALENFIFDNEELEKLESIVDKFNIFTSLGLISQEIRHSNFLAWLLNPSETHNLADYFATGFIKQALYNDNNQVTDLNLIDIDTIDLSDIQVFREWNNIDILLVDEINKVACVIENKIESKEHSNQLRKYREIINTNYPDYKKLFVYLTVYGEEPQQEKQYIPISYREVSVLIDRLLDRRQSQLNEEIRIFINHYNEMLKRYIMEESDVQALCEQLYKKHKKALDLIFKHKPDIYSDISEVLQEIIDENPALEKDHCSKSNIRFISKTLDFIPREGEGWTKSKRILLFEIVNYDKAVNLVIYIGPGNGTIRQMIYNNVKGNKLFNKTAAKLTSKWALIYKIKLASVSRMDGDSKSEMKEKLSAQMNKFFDNDYKLIEKQLMLLKHNL